jgi:hypothetical protein
MANAWVLAHSVVIGILFFSEIGHHLENMRFPSASLQQIELALLNRIGAVMLTF